MALYQIFFTCKKKALVKIFIEDIISNFPLLIYLLYKHIFCDCFYDFSLYFEATLIKQADRNERKELKY